MAGSLLGGYRALDLMDEKGFVCGKILAALGVEVIKIERPGGDPARRIPPFLHDTPDPEKSLYWGAFNTDKRSITLNLELSQGQDLFRKLVKSTDFLLESFVPGYMESLGLGYEALRQVNPGIIVTSVTSFGQTGPYAQYKGSELIASATGGVLLTTGDPDRPPVREGPDSIYFHAGTAAALGTIFALHYRQITGDGQQVDVSLQEIAASRTFNNLVIWEFGKRLLKRSGGVRRIGARSTRWIWQCKDGYVFWTLMPGRFGAPGNRALSEWIDEDGLENPLNRVTDWDEFHPATISRQELDIYEEAIGRFFMNHPKKEIADEGLKRGINAALVDPPADVLESLQLRARDYWVDLEHSEWGVTLTYPKYFFLSNETENFVRRRAPLIGEDNEDIYVKELGLSSTEVAALQKADVVSKGRQKRRARTYMEQQALAGIKVVDFGWAIAGSLVGKYLGDHGAYVIRVESSLRPDLGRSDQTVSTTATTNPNGNPMFTHLNTSKYSMTFNLKHLRAREVVDRLIRWADIVNANFTPGTLNKLGFGYEYIRGMKPEIIMAEGSAYGQTGPMAHQWGLDGTGASLSGYLHLTGWPDRGPVAPNVPYGDTLLPCFTAMAIVAALDYRRNTGKGQYIDASMIDVCIHQITPALLDWEANRHSQTRNGNRISYAAPHGVFPCQGDDRWCAIAVFTDNEWKAFCHAIGNPPWTEEPRFATLKSRKDNEDALEQLVAEWTRQHSAEAVMHMLQAAGVPAGVAETVEDLVKHDPQLKERPFLVPLKHPVIGVFNHPTPPYKLLKTRAQVRTSPCLGEHTEYVCTEFLGMSNDEFAELSRQGVFR